MLKAIPNSEFGQRIERIQEKLQDTDLDALLAFSTEAEPGNVRYLADYWASFESTAVLIPKQGQPVLIIGPESETYAMCFSRITEIRKILEFRESSNPDYPGVKMDTFTSVFHEVSDGKGIDKLGIAGLNYMPVPIYEKVISVVGPDKVIKADKLIDEVRLIKSENEITLMQQAYDLSVQGCEKVLAELKPGYTEIQLTEIARHEMLMNGAETDGYVIWVASGENTANAISRPTHRVVNKGDLLNLNIGAKVQGYSCSVCRPVALGKVSDASLDLMKIGLEASCYSREIFRAGMKMSEAAMKARKFLEARGYDDHILYGPGHGNGIMECEYPFIEESMHDEFQVGMTISVDTFLSKHPIGIRFEDGIILTEHGYKPFTNWKREIITID